MTATRRTTLREARRISRREAVSSHRGVQHCSGPWSEQEKEKFLRGLLRFGWGQWKAIETVIQSRSNRQIISHGQKVAARWKSGVDVFAVIRRSMPAHTATSPPDKEARGTTKDELVTAAHILCTMKVADRGVD